MYAIVATGGKQFKVAQGDILAVEKLDVEPGKTVELKVIFLADGSQITVDSDKLAKARVFAEVLEHFRGEKALVFKFKKRKGYKRLRGHRQELTRLQVLDISLSGVAPKAEKSAKKSAVKTDEKPAKAEKPVVKDTEKAEDKKPVTVRKATAKKVEAGEDTASASRKPVTKKTAASDEAEAKPAAAKKPATRKPAAKKADAEEKAAE
jgi:large subunit ribosomal protein L21